MSSSPIVIISIMVLVAALVCTLVGLALQVPPAVPPGQKLFTGPQGQLGLTGQTGLAGLGVAGPTGWPGPDGISIAVSSTGSTGPQGPTGNTGIGNIIGVTGFTGATGPTGNVSIFTGPTGATGFQSKFVFTGALGAIVQSSDGVGNTSQITLSSESTFWSVAPVVDGISQSSAGLWFNSVISWNVQAAPLVIGRIEVLLPFFSNLYVSPVPFPINVEVTTRPTAASQNDIISATIIPNALTSKVNMYLNQSGTFSIYLSSTHLLSAGSLAANTLFLNGFIPAA